MDPVTETIKLVTSHAGSYGCWEFVGLNKKQGCYLVNENMGKRNMNMRRKETPVSSCENKDINHSLL